MKETYEIAERLAQINPVKPVYRESTAWAAASNYLIHRSHERNCQVLADVGADMTDDGMTDAERVLGEGASIRETIQHAATWALATLIRQRMEANGLLGATMAPIRHVPFKSYDNLALFNYCAGLLYPLGFRDSSWGNDVCPSLEWNKPGEADVSVRLWVDWLDPDMRETGGDELTLTLLGDDCPEDKVFTVNLDSLVDMATVAKAATYG